MAKPDTFGAVNDAAADAFFELLSKPDSEPEKSAAPESVKESPASSDAGTTPANDDGETPVTQEADGSGNEVVGSADPASTEPEKPSEFDPEKTLAKYKTPEEKERALVESQRELVARGDENRRLKAELDSLKAGKPASPPETAVEPPKAAVPGYDEWLGRVHQAKPEELAPDEVRVKRAIASLGAEKTELKQLETKTNELATKVTTIRASVDRERAILDAMVEDLKAEPDDYALEKRIADKRAKLEKAQQELTATRLDLREQADIYARAERAHEERIVQVDRAATNLHQGIRQRETETVTQAESTKRLNEEWTTGLKNFFESDLKGLDLTPGEQEIVTLRLSAQVNDHATQNNALPDNLYQWMKGRAAAVSESVRSERLAIQKRLVNQKADLLPSKPANNVATGKPASGKTSSFKSSLKEAEAALDRAISW